MTADSEITERFADALAQWPTLDSMLGCVDCKHVFRFTDHGCPRCGSKSLLNIAKLIAQSSDAGTHQPDAEKKGGQMVET